MQTFVESYITVEGFHCWKDAFNEVSFLRDKHRHIFHVRVRKEVFHDDRDIEFILFKRKVAKHLTKTFYSEKMQSLDFGNMSCESIAKNLIDEFNLSYCSVFEDDENGAIVINNLKEN